MSHAEDLASPLHHVRGGVSGAPPPKRIKLCDSDLEELSREELVERWREQESFIDHLLESSADRRLLEHSASVASSPPLSPSVDDEIRETEEQSELSKLKSQLQESKRRETLLLAKLATREHAQHDLHSQISMLKTAAASNCPSLRSNLLDPAVNLMIVQLRKELKETKQKLEETQNDLNAWKFTPDSNTGKRLMAKCRLLLQENEELGRMVSSGRIAKLEGDLALQKNFNAELKKSQAELEELLADMDEDVEGMQSTIFVLQQNLREAKEKIAQLQAQLDAKEGRGPSEVAKEETELEKATESPVSNNVKAVLPDFGSSVMDWCQTSRSYDVNMDSSLTKRSAALCSRIAWLFDTGSFSDLILTIEEGRREFRVHKVILASLSSVFENATKIKMISALAFVEPDRIPIVWPILRGHLEEWRDTLAQERRLQIDELLQYIIVVNW
ncbi:unnamed protein product [Cyprideis torosa]|uniref:Uncharacterized protein n=1 Tax=Cyprideis torosa TaxID=163714 RepID=A0A7R8WIB1_9CRUS|nr:unnamed protein product [Cyprideis torosa]CAG0894861.1 unnamed protein product [Cyprideis torosa]